MSPLAEAILRRATGDDWSCRVDTLRAVRAALDYHQGVLMRLALEEYVAALVSDHDALRIAEEIARPDGLETRRVA